MATEYTIREAAVEYLMTNMGWNNEDGYPVDDADEKRKIITDLVNGIPAADVRPVVRGRWEKHEDFDSYGGGRFVEWVCSECDKRLRGDWATRNHIEETPAENFCPTCGADMREEK